MSYTAYKVVHILGVLMIFIALGGTVVHAANRHSKEENAVRKMVGIMNGLGLVIVLVAGFGLIASLGLGFPGWVIAKLVLWLLFGGVAAIPYRKPEWNAAVFWALPLLGGLAAYLAIYKPF